MSTSLQAAQAWPHVPQKGPALVRDPRAWDGLRAALMRMAEGRPRRFYYVPNEGNAGDALIAAGSWQFFEDAGLAPGYGRVRDLRAGDAVVYAGGGNLVPEYASCRRFLERCLEVGVASALVMPHSIRGHGALLARLDRRYTLVCRDLATLERVRHSGTRAQLVFAPDMALYLDVPRLFARCGRYRGAVFWARMAHHDRLLPYWRWRRALARRVPPPHGRVDVMRVDLEATASQPGDAHWDVSNLYGSTYPLREESDLVARDFLRFFGHVRALRTNRLHAGVAGALMGCEVTYLDNSYGKVGAVYEAWLSHLPFVSFEPPPAQGGRA